MYFSKMIIAVFLFVVLCVVVPALSQPQTVPTLVERSLDHASYVELARQWKEYIEKNGESGTALVNLARAHEYSGETEAALIASGRAVEVEPDNPYALTLHAKLLSKYKGEEERAIELLGRCREIAPDYGYGLTYLAVIYLLRGELAAADEIFKTVFKQKIIAAPLQDYAYNMLVGLPQGAVLITNGDADTVPPLALQAGMGFRTDVIVINHNLLRDPDYVEGVFERYPHVKPHGKIEQETDKPFPRALIEKIMAEDKVPLYFASSVSFNSLGFEPEVKTEGINLRASGKALSGEESARMFFESYRLDSATDWNFAWDLTPSISGLLSNYVSVMVRIVHEDNLSPATKKKLLDTASVIAEFHKLERLSYVIESLRK